MLGALIALGAPEAWLRQLPARLGYDGVAVDISPVDRSGLSATKVTVRLPDGSHEGASQPHAEPQLRYHHGHPPENTQGQVRTHEHGHGAGHHHHAGESGAAQPHNHVPDLIARIERAPLSPWVRQRAVAAFKLLAEAEGRVHGVPPEQVALHEVGAVDAVVDIVGAIEGLEQLGVSRIYSRAAALGSGWVRAAHGTMPVPAPATMLLMEGLEVASAGPVTGEATTPTGAVLLRVLSEGPPPARWRAVASGWGAGDRDPADYANALRITLAEPVAEAGEIVVLATDIDDMTPEFLEPMRAALFEAGAVDVQVWATQGKKGRMGFRVEALAPPPLADAVTAAFFRESTTIGVRRIVAERTVLSRRVGHFPAEDGSTVRVKYSEAPNGLRSKPELDDIQALAMRQGRPALEVAGELQLQLGRLKQGDVAGPNDNRVEEQ
jgi:uncharacterized protein (TIGR00299 family) protein